MTVTSDPGCGWCEGAGFLCEDNLMQPWEEGVSDSAAINCPRCNPYGTSSPISDAEMDKLVTRKPAGLG